MAYLDGSSRVGRSQGASIFWGVVSVCFAAAACFYYFKNHENETKADVMRDQVLQLSEENESLSSQKEHLQASKSEAESQLKTREDLVQEKETQLAAEEAHLEGMGHSSQNQSQQNQSQVTVVKKFNDVIHKLGKESASDVVERGGRPVLRVPNAQLFAPGDAALTPDGKTLLNQIAQGLNGQIDNFELRVVSYTETDAEGQPATGQKKDSSADSKPKYATSWDLTAARAATIAHFYRDQTSLPFLNVLVVGRGDSEPISSNTGDNHARNRRVEITVTPLPVPFHPPDMDKAAASPATPKATAKDTSKTSTDTPVPAKKKSDKDKSAAH